MHKQISTYRETYRRLIYALYRTFVQPYITHMVNNISGPLDTHRRGHLSYVARSGAVRAASLSHIGRRSPYFNIQLLLYM